MTQSTSKAPSPHPAAFTELQDLGDDPHADIFPIYFPQSDREAPQTQCWARRSTDTWVILFSTTRPHVVSTSGEGGWIPNLECIPNRNRFYYPYSYLLLSLRHRAEEQRVCVCVCMRVRTCMHVGSYFKSEPHDPALRTLSYPFPRFPNTSFQFFCDPE